MDEEAEKKIQKKSCEKVNKEKKENKKTAKKPVVGKENVKI